MRRVFDDSYIMLDDKVTMTINQKSAAGESVFFSNYRIMKAEEERDLKNKMAKNPKMYSFLIKYSVGYIPNEFDEIIPECLPQ